MTHEKEMKRMEHYEMWWNTWERRRGNRSKLEQRIEESEMTKRRVQWMEKEERSERTPRSEEERKKGTGTVVEKK